MTKKNKRNDGYLSIRKKLIAAVAMLLVATFMVASSSYAWFTLSTAPEITGIQTSVGANGNLEMALYDGTAITSDVGDSLLTDIIAKNKTWGNLVDLSSGAYGLDRITLLPARLNVASGNIAAAPLLTPVYGADGRIEELKDTTITGAFCEKEIIDVDGELVGSFAQANPNTGVLAIGNSTTMTQQQIDYRNNLAAASTYLSAAKSAAINSLNAAGSDLASYAAQHATVADGATEGTYDLTNMGLMITQMEKAAASLESAFIAIANAVYAAGHASDDPYALPGYTLATAATDLASSSISAAASTMKTKIDSIKENVGDSRDAYTALETANKVKTAAWSDLTSVCNPLVVMDNIQINGMTMTQLKTPEGIEQLAADALSSTGVTATMGNGSGAYADIANVAGNYSAGIKLKNIEYGGIKVPTVDAVMKTNVSDVVDYKTGFPAAPTGSSTNPAINEMYGYIINMAFRTNAADSQLMLQTAAAGRIYSSGAASSTMGKGSTMSFTTSSADFTEADMIALMGAIRIVFAENNTIVALAGLDTTAVTADTDGVVDAPVRIIKESTYTIVPDGENAGKITFTGKDFEDGDKSAIMELTANTPEYLSVYVYLDGDYVTNSHVAATVAKSMSGTLNLQFSSSAELMPMSYAPLAAGDSIGGGTQNPANP